MIKEKKIKDLLKESNIRPKKKLGQNFIFDENMGNQSNTFTEQWNGEEKSFLIANTVEYELILFSDNSYQDFSKNIINDFPVEIILKSNPFTITIKKYLPKN